MSVTDSLKRGSTELVLLHLLSECDRHGYELKTLLKEKSHGFYQLADTSMYPVLYRLEQEGYISAHRVLVGKRRFRIMYHLEDSGKFYYKKLLMEYRQHLFGVLSILQLETGELMVNPGEKEG